MTKHYEIVELSVCGACLYTDANGWDERETGESEPIPAPLSLIPTYFGMGPVTCKPDCDGWSTGTCEECDALSEPYFSWSACEGCGCALGGDRYDVTVAVVRNDGE